MLTRRNRIAMRSRARELGSLALQALEEDGDEIVRLDSLRSDLTAARDALGALLDRLEDLDEEQVEANRSRRVRTPAVLTRKASDES